jgi:diguanylate cyclase (GGDEF)-like protein/PAS domain S-box-containing protein
VAVPEPRAASPVDDLAANPRLAASVHRALVDHLYAGHRIGMPGNLAGMFLIAALHWSVAPMLNLAVWIALAAVVVVARLALVVAYRRWAKADGDRTRWERVYVVGALFGGLIWSAYGYLLLPYGGPNHETAGATILIGLSAGAVSTLSASRAAYIAYMVPTLLPLILRFAGADTMPYRWLLPGMAAYSIYLVSASRNMYTSLVEGFCRRFALDLLVADLTVAHERANTANTHLSQVLSEQSAILEATTVGIAYVRDGTIQKSNPRMAEMFGWPPEVLANLRFADLGLLPHGDDARRIEAVLAEGRKHENDHELARRDGSRVWCHVKATPIDPEHPAKGAIWVFVDIQDRIEADRKIRHLAYHDPLTGLPNRILLRDRTAMALAQARRQQQLACLLLVDLDGFKGINDSHGHDAGDAVLVEVARRVSGVVREVDTVARQGGDEFVVVLSGVDTRERAAAVARKVIDSLSAPFIHSGHVLRIGASIGIAVFPYDAIDAEQLLKCADAAMYRAKAEGGNGYRYFGDEWPQPRKT